VRLACGREPLVDADVELVVAEREPDASAGPQWLRFVELRQSQQLAEEAPRLGLRARWSGELHVVEAEKSRFHV
jgi:hypothetical protein